jgi:penicillin amidase
LIEELNLKRVIDWLAAPDGRFGPDPLAGRDDLLKKSLSQAVGRLTERLGPDPAGWQYGQEKFKHALIRHPLSAAVNAQTRAKLDVGPAPRGGYESTLNSTSDEDNQRTGATFRVILDAADWDNSVATSAPGQSGDPDSAHYRDLFPLWAQHRYFPLCFSRSKVESAARERLLLEPQN